MKFHCCEGEPSHVASAMPPSPSLTALRSRPDSIETCGRRPATEPSEGDGEGGQPGTEMQRSSPLLIDLSWPVAERANFCVSTVWEHGRAKTGVGALWS